MTGNGIRYHGVMYDVSSEHEVRQALRAAEERFRHLVEQLPAVVYVDATDELATALYVSPQYERLTGYSPAERLATPDLWMEMVHPDDRDRVVEESNRTNATGDDYDVEHRIIRKDGSTIWVHDHAFLVEGPDGRRAWNGVLTDVTDRKAAEEALSTRDRILEAAGYAAERFLRAPSWEAVHRRRARATSDRPEGPPGRSCSRTWSCRPDCTAPCGTPGSRRTRPPRSTGIALGPTPTPTATPDGSTCSEREA